ncbi:hypothetical protein D8B26_007888 [Coccidioides posadasii str. Silveira]|uniref:uncharacterized protein n=1 Tax=Coccidioides posadasii (strain RMSCC 757 / Silveira) TaxID=443226 RepID=UPI001BEF571A|nr:hypothetical protein D8B26_007888 [Coccidioides posadasii str. Silveira]
MENSGEHLFRALSRILGQDGIMFREARMVRPPLAFTDGSKKRLAPRLSQVKKGPKEDRALTIHPRTARFEDQGHNLQFFFFSLCLLPLSFTLALEQGVKGGEIP